MNENIIIIDDDPNQLESVRQVLVASGFNNIKAESNPRMAARLIEGGQIFDVALLEVKMQGLNGIELLEIIKSHSPLTECLMITMTDETRVAVNCMKRGACDYLVKPVSSEELVSSVNHALAPKVMHDMPDFDARGNSLKLNNPAAFAAIVTRSNEIYRIKKEAELHAHSDVPVLITGESGTGKELLARAIHAASPRAKFPFTAVNMAALTDSLFESEFFGHTRGAFTGAEKDRAGFLELTRRGTLFLDEIGQLSPAIQGKLLRFLQDGKYVKVGTNKSLQSDIRIIAATNANLSRLMVTKGFRKDLYYRLRGGWLHLPPLKERKVDIALLVPRFIKEFRHPAESCGIDEEALSLLMNYNYPGNIRELRSIIQSAVNLAQGRPICVNHFAKPFVEQNRMEKVRNSPEAGNFSPLEDIEKKYILKVYGAMQNNKLKTARVLGIVVNTLRRKLAKYGVD
jgi:two-component system, NtrC family, response regulator AtoC